MFLSGMLAWVSTMGRVVSTEFGLLIALLNGLGMVMVWLALFAVWCAIPSKNKAVSE